MSHYSVMAFGHNYKENLEKYNEETEDPDFLEFVDCRKELEMDYKNGEYKEGVKYSEKYKDFFDFIEKEHDYKEINGKIGYYHNPNAKWDWWTIWGEDKLLLKDGRHTDQALAGEIDWDGTVKKFLDERLAKYDALSEILDLCTPHKPWPEFVKNIKTKNSQSQEYKIEDLKEEYFAQPLCVQMREIVNDRLQKGEHSIYPPVEWADIDDYAMSREKFTEKEKVRALATYAVLDENGDWYAVGKMWWCSLSTETDDEQKKWDKEFYDRFIKNLNPETLVTILDCHI